MQFSGDNIASNWAWCVNVLVAGREVLLVWCPGWPSGRKTRASLWWWCCPPLGSATCLLSCSTISGPRHVTIILRNHLARGPLLIKDPASVWLYPDFGCMLMLRRMRMLRAECRTSGGCLQVMRRMKQTSRNCERLIRLCCWGFGSKGLDSNVTCTITCVDCVLLMRICCGGYSINYFHTIDNGGSWFDTRHAT